VTRLHVFMPHTLPSHDHTSFAQSHLCDRHRSLLAFSRHFGTSPLHPHATCSHLATNIPPSFPRQTTSSQSFRPVVADADTPWAIVLPSIQLKNVESRECLLTRLNETSGIISIWETIGWKLVQAGDHFVFSERVVGRESRGPLLLLVCACWLIYHKAKTRVVAICQGR
jgi:hypothetical protein